MRYARKRFLLFKRSLLYCVQPQLYLRRTGQPNLSPAAQWRKPVLQIRPRKPTRPHRNQKKPPTNPQLPLRSNRHIERDDPTIEARGRRYTSDKGFAGEGMVWLHEPDMCAGGAPESADRKGKSRENSIVGPNSSRIFDEILKLKPSDEITKFRSKLILKK